MTQYHIIFKETIKWNMGIFILILEFRTPVFYCNRLRNLHRTCLQIAVMYVNLPPSIAAYRRQWTGPTLVQVMAWRQAIIWINDDLLSGHLGTNFSKTRIKTRHFLFIKMHLKMSSVKCWPFCSMRIGSILYQKVFFCAIVILSSADTVVCVMLGCLLYWWRWIYIRLISIVFHYTYLKHTMG